jgi:hypothetical protein
VRREDERAGIDTALYVLWLAEDEKPSAQTGKITNLSRGGCFIQTKAEVRTNRTVMLRLRLPTDRWLRLQGTVAHTARKVGFGIRFTDLSEVDRDMLTLLEEYYRDEKVIVPTIIADELPPNVKRIKPL